MDVRNTRLVEPTRELKEEFLEMAREWRRLGDDRYAEAIEDFEGYVRRLRRAAEGRNLPARHVPSTTYWLVRDDGAVLGRSNLRHRLTRGLKIEGGHIGYDVRPSERCKGYGTRLLELTLQKAREMGIERALVTCDTDNVASARVIQKNGGQFDGESISPRTGKDVSRYWIDL